MGKRDDREVTQFTPALLRTGFEVLANSRQAIGRANPGSDQSIAELARQRDGLRPIAGDVKRNSVIEIDKPVLAMQKADLSLQPFASVDGLTGAQQLGDRAHLHSELAELHRWESHDPARSVSGAKTQNHAPGGDLINRCD